MAQAPRNQHGNSWLRFFLGTPLRFCITFGVVAFIFAAFRPDLAELALYNALSAVTGALTPFVGPILGICIALFAILFVFRRIRPKKKRKEDH